MSAAASPTPDMAQSDASARRRERRLEFMRSAEPAAEAIATSVEALEELLPLNEGKSWRAVLQLRAREALYILGGAMLAVYDLATLAGAVNGEHGEFSRATRLLKLARAAVRAGKKPETIWYSAHVPKIPSPMLRDPEGWVYFIQQRCGCGPGPIKIGVATDPLARLCGLQTANPLELALVALVPGSYKRERELHKQFQSARLGCTEWFRPSADLVAFIDACRPGEYEPITVKMMFGEAP